MSHRTDNPTEYEIGDTCEKMVEKELLEHNFQVFENVVKHASHNCDLVIYKGGKLRFADVKGKPRMAKMAKTGIDLHHWATYTMMSDCADFILFFVDFAHGSIYYRSIKQLKSSAEYVTLNGREMVIWPISNFTELRELTKDEILHLFKMHSNREEKYQQEYKRMVEQLLEKRKKKKKTVAKE